MTAKFTIQAENATRYAVENQRRGVQLAKVGARGGGGACVGEGLVAVMAEIRESIVALPLIQLKTPAHQIFLQICNRRIRIPLSDAITPNRIRLMSKL